MQIWASAYLIVIAGISGWAVVDDLREGQPRWRSALDLMAIAALSWLFVAHFVPSAGAALGRGAAPLFVAAFLWTGIAAHREIQEDDPDPELSARANFVAEHLGIAVGVLIFAPLIAFAGLAAFQLWQASG